MAHIPVMTDEVMKYLDPRPGDNFVDCTLGDGGHSGLILNATSPDGKVLGFDLDSMAIEVTAENLRAYGERLIVLNKSFVKLEDTVNGLNFGPIAGVFADFGLSSPQLEERLRGFSFLHDEPLDMRYSTSEDLTAEQIVNRFPKSELVKIMREYGEERLAEPIAEAIMKARREVKILTTAQLVKIIRSAVPASYEHGRINPATRVFQALRIATNDELDAIESVLPQALEVAAVGAALVFISFHSLEDRLVKNFFKYEETAGRLEVVTRKPITASDEEKRRNPRARSAKLRAALKLK
jgi:16S rRNA (cytosine1402-N4)-methyltransferase